MKKKIDDNFILKWNSLYDEGNKRLFILTFLCLQYL